MMDQIDEQRELDAVEYAKTTLVLMRYASRHDDETVPVPTWVMRGLVARATRPHD